MNQRRQWGAKTELKQSHQAKWGEGVKYGKAFPFSRNLLLTEAAHASLQCGNRLGQVWRELGKSPSPPFFSRRNCTLGQRLRCPDLLQDATCTIS